MRSTRALPASSSRCSWNGAKHSTYCFGGQIEGIYTTSHFKANDAAGAVVGERLAQFVSLAPLHQPQNLAPIRALLVDRPELPQVACFDTAFHCDRPAVARALALLPEITERGVGRYGFHGLSYEYIASVRPPPGSGSSSIPSPTRQVVRA